MSLFVKICGIRDGRAASAAAEAGADAVGFVFAPSPRRVSPHTAAALAAELPAEVLKVAVFRRPARSEVERVLEVFRPDLVQADEGISPLPGVEFLPVYREGSGARPAPGTRFLYEGKSSGVGRLVDLDTAASVATRGRMVLAGGLHPGNVATVVARVGPYGVDVSSGVETSPGVKDPSLIAEFVAVARSGVRA